MVEAVQSIAIDVDTALGIRGGDIDDAHAIALLAAHRDTFRIEGVGVVGGNVTLPSGLRSTAFVTRLLGIEAPVAAGAKGPADRALVTGHSQVMKESDGAEEWIYGEVAATPMHPAPAWKLLSETVRRAPLVLLAVGPLTNVARFLDNHPELKPRIRKIVNMGGWFVGENRGPEFNIMVDPPAARAVYESGIPMEIVPLEMTARTLLRSDEIDHWPELGPAGRLFHQGTIDWITVLHERFGAEGCNLHDPLAAACAVSPGMFELTGIVPGVDDETGKTWIVRHDDDSHVRLVTDFDVAQFHEFYHQGMNKALLAQG